MVSQALGWALDPWLVELFLKGCGTLQREADDLEGGPSLTSFLLFAPQLFTHYDIMTLQPCFPIVTDCVLSNCEQSKPLCP